MAWPQSFDSTAEEMGTAGQGQRRMAMPPSKDNLGTEGPVPSR